MPRHNDVSRSITGYVTCYILAKRALHPTAARLWAELRDRYAHKLLTDWGW